MRIGRFEIGNHSRVSDMSVEIRDHAVIVGANDVGKTSVLRLLNLLLGASVGQLYQEMSVTDLNDASRELFVEAMLVDFTDEERRLFPNEISIDRTDRTESLRVRLTTEIAPDDEHAVAVRRFFPEAGHDRGPTRDQLVAIGWRYLPAHRSMASSYIDGPKGILQTLLAALDLGAEKRELTSLLETFNQRLNSNDRIDTLRSDVASHLSKSMPRSIESDELVVRTFSDPDVDLLRNVSMFLKRDGSEVTISEQSDGIRALMSMTLFDLAEGAANIVAIDEPELHLHPASQRTLAGLLADARNQKLLVTHSPYIVHRFEPAQVLVVTPDGYGRQLSATRLSRIEKMRANWWSPRLLEALTSRQVVVVEGTADRLVVEAAARTLGLDLDRMGVIVLDIGGADNFPDVYSLIGHQGFGVPTYGLVDHDESGKWLNSFGIRPADALNQYVWVATHDLEDEYCRALGGPTVAQHLIAAGVCREQGVLQACRAARVDDLTPEAVAAFCRGPGRKVPAASAVAHGLTQSDVKRCPPIDGLLSALLRTKSLA